MNIFKQRQIDKAGDLLESSNHCQGPKAKKFKESTQTLKQEMNCFNDKLEDIRQRLEDTSRCFDLLARCQSTAEESCNDVLTELNQMVTKSGNEKLIEICQEIINSSVKAPNNTETPPIKAPPMGQHRRRSVSSFAFIYKCNHHAAGVPCSCWESEPEENTESAKLKKKYVQSLQNDTTLSSVNNLKNVLDRKNSYGNCNSNSNTLGLDNIKEVRESTEDLLEASEKNDSGVSGCGRCDSGLSSTGNASSVGVCRGLCLGLGLGIGLGADELYNNNHNHKKRLQRTCLCQYCCNETGGSSSGSSGSHADHNDHQQYGLEENDVFPKR